jgi:methylmalonyl-CoA/ethylmalonyl-CoA epimerase
VNRSEAGYRLSQIGQIAVNVHDLDRATGFYRDTLGLKFLFQVPTMSFFDCQGVRLMLARPESPEFDHPGSVIYFRVEDIEQAFESLSQRGVEFMTKPHRIAELDGYELRMAFFQDPEGNTLAVMAEVPTG